MLWLVLCVRGERERSIDNGWRERERERDNCTGFRGLGEDVLWALWDHRSLTSAFVSSQRLCVWEREQRVIDNGTGFRGLGKDERVRERENIEQRKKQRGREREREREKEERSKRHLVKTILSPFLLAGVRKFNQVRSWMSIPTQKAKSICVHTQDNMWLLWAMLLVRVVWVPVPTPTPLLTPDCRYLHFPPPPKTLCH